MNFPPATRAILPPHHKEVNVNKKHKKKTWTREEESALAESMYHFIHPESPEYDERFTMEVLALVGTEEFKLAQAEAKAFFTEMDHE